MDSISSPDSSPASRWSGLVPVEVLPGSVAPQAEIEPVDTISTTEIRAAAGRPRHFLEGEAMNISGSSGVRLSGGTLPELGVRQ
nr:hypothetical protein [Streptomyces sp. TLI_235]